MPVIEIRTEVPLPSTDVAAWLGRPGAAERLSLPWRGGFEWFPLADTRRIPTVTDAPGGRAAIVDRIVYTPPFGAVGEKLLDPLFRGDVERELRFRRSILSGDLLRHAPYVKTEPLRVAVTGASGLVGSQLCAFLTAGGHKVLRFARGRTARAGEIGWDPATGRLDHEALEGLDAVVHLAGESLSGGRWTEARKQAIRSSRVEGTKLLAEGLAVLRNPPHVFLSASAVGYYGDRGEERVEETAGAGTGFLAEVARAWEVATAPAFLSGIRTVTMRFGIVLTARGGALAKMRLPFSLGAGGPIGTGRQGFSWVALDDLIYAIYHLMRQDDIRGAVNVVAPAPLSQEEFAAAYARSLHRPALVSLPAGVVKTVFGELGEEMLLGGQYVVPANLRKSGYKWAVTRIEDALER